MQSLNARPTKSWFLLTVIIGFWFLDMPSVGMADEPSTSTDDQLFSGPQVGEKLPAFKVRSVLGTDVGKEIDFVTLAAGKPIVLIFVHEVSRPTMGFTRALTAYTVTRKADGLSTGIIWLDDDATTAENNIKRVKHALTPTAPTGVSIDGREGPGSYGLNRKVALTILVGKEGKVTANFALVQPSLQADLPKVLEKVVAVAGGRGPDVAELMRTPDMAGDPAKAHNDEELRNLLQPLIQKVATKAQVEQAAKTIEEAMAKRPEIKSEVGRIANTIVSSGKLSNYGTTTAQEVLQKWAKEHKEAPPTAPNAPPSPPAPAPPNQR